MPSEVSHEQIQIADSGKKQKIDAISPHQSLPKTLNIFPVIYRKSFQMKVLTEIMYVHEAEREKPTDSSCQSRPITPGIFISSGIATS